MTDNDNNNDNNQDRETKSSSYTTRPLKTKYFTVASFVNPPGGADHRLKCV